MHRSSPFLLAFVLLVTACDAPSLPQWVDADDHRWRPLEVPSRGEVGFTSMGSRRTGVDFSNRLDQELALENEHRLIGSGVTLGDVDGDGWTDIYLARLQGPNVLYRNLGNWRFEDVTEGSGTALADRFSTGAAMADLDGDGDPDLVTTSLGGPDAVLLNDGAGRFTELPDAGLAPGLGSSTATLADVDGDGDLDLYVAAYKAESASDVLRMLERPLSDITVGQTDSLVVAPEFRDHYRVEMRDGRQMVVEQADVDRLYLNDGTGRFEPVSWTGGAFLNGVGRPLEEDLDDFGLAARFYDVDRDGNVDLYVCNDFDDPDQLWLGLGDGTFRAAPALALRTTPHASMSVDFADVDRDGSVDIFVAEMRTRDHSRWLKHVPFQRRLRKPVGVMEDRPQIQRNVLFLNRGDGTFAEVGEYAGVDASDWTWTSMFLDVDLDGYEDLLVANGYSRDTQHGDVVDEITSLQGQADSRELKRLYPPLATANVAFRNRGDLTFVEVGEAWGFGVAEDISHGMAAGDLDGDGDLDLVVNRLGDPALLLRNDATAPRLALRLKGVGGNTAGVGARVRMVGSEGLPDQERQISAGGLYLSGSEPLLTFAAGRGDSLRVEVDWPGGERTVMEGIEADRLYEVYRPAGTNGVLEEPLASSGAEPGPLFTDRSGLLEHTHPEADFDDFLRQPLLPYQLSRLGPGVSWIDVDRDGDPDLVVPPGGSGALSFLRNDGTSFTEVPLRDASSASPLDRTAAVALPGPDGPRIVFGQSSYRARTVEEAQVLPAAVVAASGAGSVLELETGGLSSTGPVAVADVDGDGVLELFVGGRMIKGFYPLPASSMVFRDGPTGLRPDSSLVSLLEEVGMVSGAVFSDVDGDGDPDLILALEWGTVRLLVNEGGRLTDRTDAWGLAELEGRWNGIATGDFDSDGRPDLVVTGWGRNVRFAPSEDRPVVLYHADLDGNGTWDLIPTQAQAADGVLRTLEGYDRLRRAIPSLRSRLPTFESYGEASLQEILGVEEVFGRTARRFEHLVLMNRDGRFEARALPAPAQIAPATGVAVGDLDGDGNEDVFLAQNFFPTHLDQPRFDAGLGLVLLGNGAGGFEPLSAAESGVRIFGDQRGAAVADFDGDGRLDVAVAQNGARTRLFRNVGASPGLRVRLEGPPGNPDAIGATIRVEYLDGPGPAREVQGGSGYWSLNGTTQVMGLRAAPVAVLVLWPGGGESRVEVDAGARTITVRAP
jgi:hypothetical protein